MDELMELFRSDKYWMVQLVHNALESQQIPSFIHGTDGPHDNKVILRNRVGLYSNIGRYGSIYVLSVSQNQIDKAREILEEINFKDEDIDTLPELSETERKELKTKSFWIFILIIMILFVLPYFIGVFIARLQNP